MESIFKYLDNNYFVNTFLENEFKKQFKEDLKDKFKKVKDLYNNKLETSSEANLELKFISPILNILGYETLYEQNIKLYGKTYKIDFALFENKEKLEEYLNLKDKATNENILVVCENKAFKEVLDNKKVDKENPHNQLMRYLQALKVDYGFLSNGKFWRFYDISKNEANKVYCQVDLRSIIEDDNIEAFEYFYHIFKKDNFIKENIKEIKKQNEQAKINIENELKEIIYGKDSIIKTFGEVIYKNHPEADENEIFQNSLIFAFRLLFIAYFEDKFYDLLFKKHKYYKNYSLKKILEYVEKTKEQSDFMGFKKILDLFNILDKGDENLEIPLLNGGLFKEDKAKLIKTPKLLANKSLKEILSKLMKSGLLRRDFKTLSIKHIGNIYEGLLEFEFKKAVDTTYYLIYKEGKSTKEGYYDLYDYEKINKTANISHKEEYKKNDIFLANSSNNRKQSASYYTPELCTSFMVKEAIDQRLSYDKDILNLKILDNACGSGHFLIDALNYLTKISYENLDDKLKNLIKEEKEKIKTNIIGMKDIYKVDELSVLKRILLKKLIYGVDINPFAIELTKLALWIDSFIFGTPLSFIEHHIKQGNSLIGSNFNELIKSSKLQKDTAGLFEKNLEEEINTLKKDLKELDNINDTTKEEIEKSKEIYKKLSPNLEKLNKALDYTTYLKFINNNLESKEKIPLFDIDPFNIEKNLEEKIQKLKNKYSFFNYEVEFAECFSQNNPNDNGFNVIIGNPPWDKTKFEDKDFFSGYRSSYRTENSKEKKEIRENILSYTGVKEEYDNKKEFIKNFNEYCKLTYPYNRGSGDGNLFRFFIEKNLSLLNKNSNLSYLTPSSLSYEDGSINLRKHIIDNFKINFFYQFENKNIFKDVDNRYKFCLLNIENKKAKEEHIVKTRFMQRNLDILNTENEIIDYSYEEIKKAPFYMIYELKDKKDLELIKRFYAKFEKVNENYIDFRRELDMANDRDLFKETKEEGDLILFEGKMINHFNSNFEKERYYINKESLEEKLKTIEVSRLIKEAEASIPKDFKAKTKKERLLKFLNLENEQEFEKFISYDKEYFKIAHRMVASNTNERTLIFSLLGKNITFGNSLYASIPKKYILEDKTIKIKTIPIKRILFLSSIFNSIILDYIARFIIDMNATKTYLMRLPIPMPSEKEIEEKKEYKTLYLNAIKLQLSYDIKSFEELKDKFEIKDEDIPNTDKKRDLLKIENDIIVAKLYEVGKKELKHITSEAYFKTLNTKNPAYLSTLLENFEKYV